MFPKNLRSKLKSFSPTIQSQGTTGDIVSIYLPQGNKTESEITADLTSVKGILGETVEEIKIEQLYNYKNSKFEGTEQTWDLKLLGKNKGSRAKKNSELNESDWHKVVEMLKTKMPKILYFPSA